MATTEQANGSQEQNTAVKTGIKVVIVGAGSETTESSPYATGFGGLTAAIECHRQGHDVSVYESFKELKVLGDIISFGSNAGRIFRRWHCKSGERVSDRLRPLSIDLTNHGFNIYKWTGEFVINQPSPKADPEAPVFNGHRGELHTIVFEYARDELGIPIYLGKRTQEYFEDETQAGIVLEDGEKVMPLVYADVVIGSDGVRSKARQLVLGYDDRPKPSGYAVFRAWFPNTDMMADVRTRKFCENGDTFQGWIGPDVHFLFSTIKGGKDCCWVMTHKDDNDIEESWSLPGKMEDVYKVIDGWDPLCKAIVEKTPSCESVDWKLVYRDPLPRWVSDHGRTCLLGDSAHPFLPTSAQGATQALEDGVTLAYCLKVAGKSQIPAALRAFQDIRYERVKAVQKTGETTRDMWHKADWDRVKDDPKSVQMPREDWILGHDAEAHASQVFQASFNKYVTTSVC
ncbi:putative MAK1-like monooxygenase [Aureobasidium subglaciale]|nr:putative MAK1-like monooxygenase [Aureobasidium subglaciale]